MLYSSKPRGQDIFFTVSIKVFNLYSSIGKIGQITGDNTIGRNKNKNSHATQGKNYPRPFKFMDSSLQRENFLKRMKNAGQQAEKYAAKQAYIERVAYKAVFFLNNVKGTVMRRKFINIHGDKRDDGSQGDKQEYCIKGS